MAEVVNLGDAFEGNDDAPEYNRWAMDQLIPVIVEDDAMRCGGREGLHQSILARAANERAQQCGKCAVVGCVVRIT
ncbi:MAG: hypothetical protein U0520_00455 [Candidatus Saccharimonadales bacterium]